MRAALLERYGAAAPDLHVLMLMWEMAPLVAGGTWTACYHLVRQLHRRGAKVTIVVPWLRDRLDDSPFGVDVPIIDMGMEPPPNGSSPYGLGSASAYGQASSPYGGIYSAYGMLGPWGNYGSSTLYALLSEFERRVAARLVDHRADAIHAHDWVTFDAARALAEAHGVPWIAHFHSTEAERQPSRPDPLTARIEQSALDSAAIAIVPSKVTKAAVLAAYRASDTRIEVIPNLLSDAPPPASELGRFETKRVIFLGRLSEQKGVDRFFAVAEQALRSGTGLRFEVFGEGPEQYRLRGSMVQYRGPLQWDKRGQAFQGATALIVPSRFEPFGMVILEAMQHRVPVIYAAAAGAAEVLDAGIKLPGDDIVAIAASVTQLAGNLGHWEAIVSAQAAEVERYPGRIYEELVIACWKRVTAC